MVHYQIALFNMLFLVTYPDKGTFETCPVYIERDKCMKHLE